MAHGGRETEIKLAVVDAAGARRKLREAGFRISRRRLFESNTVYDTPSLDLRARRELLRLRTAGKLHSLTYKGPPVIGRHKSRPELEIVVSDAKAAGLILAALGFAPAFRYEKYRTEFSKPGQRGLALLDETPIGCFLELEGPPRWIDRAARSLGFRRSDYITQSYGGLYLDYCAARAIRPSHMLFKRT